MKKTNQTYNIYKLLSETLGHIPLKINETVEGITWKIEAKNFMDFYEEPNLEQVYHSLNII